MDYMGPLTRQIGLKVSRPIPVQCAILVPNFLAPLSYSSTHLAFPNVLKHSDTFRGGLGKVGIASTIWRYLECTNSFFPNHDDVKLTIYFINYFCSHKLKLC